MDAKIWKQNDKELVMNIPLLSICIPTYNRCSYLIKSIQSIVCQKEFLNGSVEIVVSDNASTDDTCTEIQSYLNKYHNIFYHKNPKNISDKNYPMVLSKAHGVYRRLCNDTLFFFPGSLSIICKIIEENRNEKPYICWTNGLLKTKKEIFCTDFKGYVNDVSFYMTSIACFGLWEDECTDIQYNTEGCELRLWQVKYSLKIAFQKNSVLLVNQNLTRTTQVKNKDISYGLYEVFYENYFLLINDYMNHGLNDIDKEHLEKDLLLLFFKQWCVRWEIAFPGLQYSDQENLKEKIWEKYCKKPYWKRFLLEYRIELMKNKLKLLLQYLKNGKAS